jgi:hypothetical protein
VPATSVAPAFKLTRPCEWVETRLAHLLTGADFFLVGAHDDAKLYEAGDKAAAVRAATASVKEGRLAYAPFPKRG